MSEQETERDVEISRLLDEALRELRERGAIDTASYEARRPDLADELNGLLETLRAVDTAVEDWRLVPAAAETTHDAVDSHPVAASPALPLPACIGRYEIRGQIGAGGMGTVYRAFDPQLQRDVAVKVPKFNGPEAHQAVARQRFLREARAAAPIRHKHVCPIHDVGEHHGVPYVVMAYVAGMSLAQRLAAGGRFEDVQEAVALARQVAEALEVVHGHGIIHRDLKPGNILLDKDGQAVLTDFGLARSCDDSEHLTADGALLGTPAYMAPEQASLTLGPTGPWTDIYSLGVVLYQMLTGRLPFEGPTLEVIYKIAQETPPRPTQHRPDLDPALEGILLKALARRGQERYPGARAFGDVLGQWAAGPAAVPDGPAASVPAAAPRPPETVVQAGLPDGSAITVTVRHDGPAPPRQVKVAVQEEKRKNSRRRRRLLVSVTVMLTAVLVAVGLSVPSWLTDRDLLPQPGFGQNRDPIPVAPGAGSAGGPPVRSRPDLPATAVEVRKGEESPVAAAKSPPRLPRPPRPQSLEPFPFEADGANAYVERGLKFQSEKKYDLALADLAAALRHDPKNIRAYRTRALVFQATGDNERAQQDLEAAKQLYLAAMRTQPVAAPPNPTTPSQPVKSALPGPVQPPSPTQPATPGAPEPPSSPTMAAAPGAAAAVGASASGAGEAFGSAGGGTGGSAPATSTGGAPVAGTSSVGGATQPQAPPQSWAPQHLAFGAEDLPASFAGGRTSYASPSPRSDGPLLRREPSGPSAFVTAVAFSPDGTALYATGYDKVVRVWKLNPRTGQFALDRDATYRVPIGPDSYGVLNALAVSPDGSQLAAAGEGLVRDDSRPPEAAPVVPKNGRFTDAMRLDEGVIYIFDTSSRKVKALRGHRGPVVALAFAPASAGKPPLLASAAREWDAAAQVNRGGVRLWDAHSAAEVDRLPPGNLPDPYAPPVRPGLAVRHTGTRLKEVQVAVAWMDGRLRTWDVDRGTFQMVRDGPANNTVQFLPGGTALAGSSGRLKVWNTPPGRPPTPTLGTIGLPALPRDRAPTYYLPAAMTLASSAGNGVLDCAAVVLTHAWGEHCHLGLYGVGNNFGLGLLRAPLPLWAGDLRVPVLAAAPRGRFLAVAGNPDHTIQVYSLEALRRGVREPHQVLRGNGTTFRHLAFVQQGKNLGLLLNEQREAREDRGRPPKDGDWIFDFQAHALTRHADTSGWRTALAPQDGWTVEPSAQNKAFTVRRDGQPAGMPVRLGAAQRATTIALLPSSPAGVPILAVAFNEAGDTGLVLYDVPTGEAVRWLTGPVNDVKCLAFSADGRMLAAAAEDQTVCVWNLADLGATRRSVGELRGVAVREEGSRLLVGKQGEILEPANRGKLQPGDVIEGRVVDGQLKPLRTAGDFFASLSPSKPGDRVVLRLRDARGQSRDEALVLSQGAYERPPLFCLFVEQTGSAPRPAPERPSEWFAWNPFGYYVASDVAVERHLGWHFNTQDPTSPTQFAATDQPVYRKRHYRENLLTKLIETKELSKPVDENDPLPDRLPRPVLELTLDEADDDARDDAEGLLPVRTAPRALRLTIDRFEYRDQIEAVEWRVNGGPWQPFPPSDLLVRRADLGDAAARPGVYQFEARLTTQGRKVKDTWTTMRTVRYQRPKPVIAISAQPVIVNRRAYSFEFAVRPGTPGHAFSVTVTHNGKPIPGEPLVQNSPQGQPLRHKLALNLEEGENELRIQAVNQDPLAKFEANEKDLRTVVVRYYKPANGAAPIITLTDLLPVIGGKEGPAQPIRLGEPMVVGVPRVHVRGKIAAGPDGVTAAEVRRDDKIVAAILPAGLPPKAAQEVPIDQELTLQPGSQKYRFVARTANGPEGTAPLVIVFQPPLPRVRINPPDGAEVPEDQPDVVLTGRLELPPDPQPFEMHVLVNGERDNRAAVALAGNAWTAKLRLRRAGPNRILVLAANAWNTPPTTSEPVDIEVTPRANAVTFTSPPAVVHEPIIELTAEVESTSPLKAEQVKVEVGGEIVSCPVEVRELRPGVWQVRARLPLSKPGKTQVRLRVENARRGPPTVTFEYRPRMPLGLQRAEDVADQLRQADTLQRQGRLTEAIARYEEVLPEARKLIGPEHPNNAVLQNNLALLYQAAGDYARAEGLYQASLRDLEARLGRDHPDVATALCNLGSLYQAQGAYPKAEAAYQRSLQILAERFGTEHPQRAAGLSDLAQLYHAEGRYAAAEPLYQRALAVREKALGRNHPSLAADLANYAELLRALKRPEEAAALDARARTIRAESR
jgi:WD40 repeat protein/tetratricopeptide (TPR) repeat protein/tRNA A-37 threonylcarbamoyl transferase component Bud32